jgi:hypothetical protein
MEEGDVPLAWLNPSIPISWPGRVLRTPAGPLTSRLPPDTPGVRRHLSVDLEGSLPCRCRPRGCAYTSRLPSSAPLCPSRWRCPGVGNAAEFLGVGNAAECEDYLACQHADHLRPRSPRTRERRRGTPKAPWTVATVRERLPGQAAPGRGCDNPTLCALRSASQNKVLSCWEIAVAGCGRSRRQVNFH